MSAFFAPQEAADEEDEEQSVDLEEEVLEVIKDSSGECVPEHIMEQTVELAVSSGEAGSSGPGVNDTISVAATAVVKSVAGARLPGTAKVQCCDSRNSSLLQQSPSLLVLVKRGLQIAKCSSTAVAVAVAKSVGNGEARPPGFAQYRATTGSEFRESSGEFPDEVGASWSRAIGTTGTAATAAVEKSADEVRLRWVTKNKMQENDEAMKIDGQWRYFPKKIGIS